MLGFLESLTLATYAITFTCLLHIGELNILANREINQIASSVSIAYAITKFENLLPIAQEKKKVAERNL